MATQSDKQKLFEELLKKKGIQAPAGPQLVRRSEPGPHPLSFQQRRIWFLQQFDPRSPAYNDPTALRIQGELDIPALERTFFTIIQRHQVLQNFFPSENGQPVQAINPMTSFPIEIVIPDKDSAIPPDEQIRRFVNDYAARPFDLGKDRLICAALLKVADKDFALVVNTHHIVIDGWSKGIMLEELIALYRAFSEEKPSPLPEPSIRYTDYVYWRQEWGQGKIFETQLSYWKEKLHGAPPVLEFPTDHSRPAEPSGKGSVEPFSINASDYAALIQLAKQEDVTFFMLMTAAFNTLLYRYSGQSDISIGTPVAGRNRVELERLIGLFVNTLVLRNDLSGDITFRDLLKRVRKTCLEAYSHQDMPFEKLVEELNPQRDLSINPLFQVMFQLQNAPMPPVRMEGLSIAPIQLDTGAAQVDLSLTLWEEGDGLKGTFEFSLDLFERATIQRLIRHFRRLLDEIMRDCSQPVPDIAIIPDDELKQMLVEWNNTAFDYPRDACIYEMFEAAAAAYPEQTAAFYGNRRISYSELNRNANRLARFLKQHQAMPGTYISICMENSLELIIGIIGILKTGAAYIPMDPEYPEDRLYAILDEVRPLILLTDKKQAQRLEEFSGMTVKLDEWSAAASDEDAGNIKSSCAVRDAACVIFTSGSTGKPKGIVLDNGNIVNLIYSFLQSYKPTCRDRVLPLTSIASASFVGEILPVLSSGGAIVLADKASFLDMKKLAALLIEYEVSILSTVPSMIARLNAVGWRPGKLRLLLSGGETLSPGDIDHIFDSVTVVNGYGLTEASICSTFIVLNELDMSANPVISVGKPIINTRVYILDRRMNPVPVGVPGEICIAGDGLAKEYLNNPEITRERFFPNPFSKDERILKTGDLGSWMPDGSVRFLGRIDTQVQIHGHRIELAEIETHMGLHPQVEEAVVLDREITPGDKRLVAYFVAQSGEKISSGLLRSWLSKRIPEYMIPSLFEQVEKIPLNANGKVDVSALPVPVGLRPELEVEFRAPQSEIERKIAEVWREFLHMEQVGIEDNFFDLGGHSLLLTQVHNRLSQLFSKELTIVDMFRYPTILALSRYLGADEVEQKDVYSKLQDRANKQRQAFNRQNVLKRRLK